MAILIAVIVSGALFIGFLMLTLAEAKSGRRALAGARERLDQHVIRSASWLRAADLEHTLFTKTLAGVSLIAHEVVHGLLIGIRAFERTLTRTAKHLREKATAAEEVK